MNEDYNDSYDVSHQHAMSRLNNVSVFLFTSEIVATGKAPWRYRNLTALMALNQSTIS